MFEKQKKKDNFVIHEYSKVFMIAHFSFSTQMTKSFGLCQPIFELLLGTWRFWSFFVLLLQRFLVASPADRLVLPSVTAKTAVVPRGRAERARPVHTEHP